MYILARLYTIDPKTVVSIILAEWLSVSYTKFKLFGGGGYIEKLNFHFESGLRYSRKKKELAALGSKFLIFRADTVSEEDWFTNKQTGSLKSVSLVKVAENLLRLSVSLTGKHGCLSCSYGTITKTCLYNSDPLKPHFYIVTLGFTGVYIIFLISAKKHSLWVVVRTGSPRRF